MTAQTVQSIINMPGNNYPAFCFIVEIRGAQGLGTFATADAQEAEKLCRYIQDFPEMKLALIDANEKIDKLTRANKALRQKIKEAQE